MVGEEAACFAVEEEGLFALFFFGPGGCEGAAACDAACAHGAVAFVYGFDVMNRVASKEGALVEETAALEFFEGIVY